VKGAVQQSIEPGGDAWRPGSLVAKFRRARNARRMAGRTDGGEYLLPGFENARGSGVDKFELGYRSNSLVDGSFGKCCGSRSTFAAKRHHVGQHDKYDDRYDKGKDDRHSQLFWGLYGRAVFF
jgi:hypothetical protein